ALCLATFVIGLCGVCWGIREALPFPDIMLVKPKLDHLAAHHDEYDTLFIGSSRIYYQIIPALFDQLAAEQGLPTRSFNAAIAGMRPPEDAYYFDYILRHPPKRLRWVFIELASVHTEMDPDKIGTVRAIYWHDLPRLWLIFQRALSSPRRLLPRRHTWLKALEAQLEPFGDFFAHLPLFIRNETNLGGGSVFTSRLIYATLRPPMPPRVTLGADLAGWIRTGRPEVMTGNELADFEKALAQRRVAPAYHDRGDSISQQALETMIAKIEKLGATPVLVVPPTTNKRNFYPAPEREKKTVVLDFCDLEKFPELYENRYRLDTDHVNTEGARVFTRIFVETWAQEVKRRQ
ncbi:MAG TPA: hypothetical protein VEO95_09120, partial [Chthoniobacteraceae bacterium]|nr:hypothetical protein [Chthoniobacteraceae bacterium]